ncbi:hypothetical protein [Micromonospora sp. NPDC049282]|uniref:hypothetical protein n=1 Tax=Micromonospora sp. NPDC049282 TaxID=3364269 RepID=UPI003719D938
MAHDPLLARARGAWLKTAGVPMAFPDARPEPSRRVARALGFRQLGAQLSLSLTGE